MSTTKKVRSIFEKMPEAFVPEKANGVKADIQINLSGEGGGNWFVRINDGNLSVVEGQAEDPDLTMNMSARDYVALTMGEASAMALFALGRIKVEGNMGLLLKFREIFDRDRARS